MNNHNAHATIGLLSSEIETVESDIARIDENIKKLTALRGQKNLILNSLTSNRQRIVDVLTPNNAPAQVAPASLMGGITAQPVKSIS